MPKNILLERNGRVGTITLNRPEVLNALNETTMREVVAAAVEFDEATTVGAIVITGFEKAFAAGADIKQMQAFDFTETYLRNWVSGWDRLAEVRIPIVAAVAGFALGGGCELAMLCDIIIAADTARFGQPEIKLGILPGMGGSQRLTRAIGKSKAMEMCLTGRMMSADEAERTGLVSRVVPADSLLEEAHGVANEIASMARSASMLTKEAVNRAYESSLAEGVRFERRVFHAAFSTPAKDEGMAAFVEKRPAKFHNTD